MAVYTEVDDDELRAFLADYDVGALLSFKGIAEGVENTNYLVHTEAGSYILTLYERRVERADLPFFLGLMEHLAAAGIACPTPIRTRSGKVLGDIAAKPAALVSYLEGVWVRRPNPAHCRELGAAMAGLHLAGADFALRRPNTLGPSSWPGLVRETASSADTVAPGLGAEVATTLDELTRAWPSGLPTGVIHADLFPDNVFFIDGRISGLIDFYFACNDALAYDIAICLNAWCFEPDAAFNITKARQLLKAYEGVRPLAGGEFEALPLLARGAALRFLLTRLYDWINTPASALVKPKDPGEYLRKLRFHRAVSSASEYGLDAR
jgi:homoserine kinase type II